MCETCITVWRTSSGIWILVLTTVAYETEDIWLPGLPIWVSTWKQEMLHPNHHISEWEQNDQIWNKTYGRRRLIMKDLVQPLEGPMQVHFDPARGGGDVLPVILGSPAFHKAHPDSAHFSQLVDRLKSMVNRLGKKRFQTLESEEYKTWVRRVANSWLLKILRLQPGGILHTWHRVELCAGKNYL